MAKLIQMRQRIKAIETIKKVTHAMRLISMSMHSRLRGRMPLLKNYNNHVAKLFNKLRHLSPHWKSPVTHPEGPKDSNPLFILIGSQKGLCGTFNTGLLKEFEQIMPEAMMKQTFFISVGKKAVDYLEKKDIKGTIKTFSELTMRNFPAVSNEIVDLIVNAKTPYTCVKVLSNELKTFFLQNPRTVQIIPLDNDDIPPLEKEPKADASPDSTAEALDETQEESQEAKEQNDLKSSNDTDIDFNEDYVWYQKPDDLLDKMAPQYIASHINTLLMESLLAEQAARFLSMDTATRNAKNLLEETTLQYNKLRQAKITKELTELATNFD